MIAITRAVDRVALEAGVPLQHLLADRADHERGEQRDERPTIIIVASALPCRNPRFGRP